MKIVFIFLMVLMFLTIAATYVFGQSTVDEAMALIDKGELDQAWEIAHQLETEQIYPAALSILNAIREKYPTDRNRVNIMAEMAAIYEKTGKLKEAIAVYQNMIKEDPTTYEDHPYYSYQNYARLRVIYLNSQPIWARHTRDELFQELSTAFSEKNLDKIKQLLKKGDFLIGPMYSEPGLANAEDVYNSLKDSLQNPSWRVTIPMEIWEGQWALAIENWKDKNWPEYDLLYLAVTEGLFGWEWGEIIFSKSEWKEKLGY